MRNQIKQVMSSVFEISIEKIPDDFKFEDNEKWDSIGHIELMLALEDAFQIEITMEAMTETLSLDSIENYIRDLSIR